MASNNNNNNNADAKQLNSKIDAIKEIIFGQNMEQYEAEFSSIRENIKLNLEAMDLEFKRHKELMMSMEKSLLEKMDANQKQLLAEIKNLEDKKTDRKLLADSLTEMAKKIGS